MTLPTIQQLRYLVSLSDNGSFHAAADACHVSQSTLSTGIKNLENQLGTLLVDRSNRVLRFTDTGNEVLRIARELLEQAAHIARVSQLNRGILTKRLRMGGIPTILPFVLPGLMERASIDYPDLSLELSESTSDDLLDRLLQGRLDLLILALPYKKAERDNLITLDLFNDPFHLAYPASLEQDLADIGDDISHIPPDRLLLMAEGHCLRGHALDACSLRRSSKIGTFEINSLQTLKGLVASGVGYTFFPDVAIRSGFLASSGILTKPVHADRTISLVWRKSSDRREDFEAIADLLKAPTA